MTVSRQVEKADTETDIWWYEAAKGMENPERRKTVSFTPNNSFLFPGN
jgi:hypothetical protein